MGNQVNVRYEKKIRKLINSHIPRILIISLKYFLFKSSLNKFFINDLTREVENLFDYNSGFYVELGANDGVTQSNTIFLNLRRNWRGILIEPYYKNFKYCKKFRKKNNFIFNAACVPFGFGRSSIKMTYADLMTRSDELNLNLRDSDEHNHMSTMHLANRRDKIHFKVEAKPLSQLLDVAGAPEVIDFLSLDVEGAELEVLKGIDHDRYKFKFMIIEIQGGTEIFDFLEKNSYQLVKKISHHDYIFKNKSIS